ASICAVRTWAATCVRLNRLRNERSPDLRVTSFCPGLRPGAAQRQRGDDCKDECDVTAFQNLFLDPSNARSRRLLRTVHCSRDSVRRWDSSRMYTVRWDTRPKVTLYYYGRRRPASVHRRLPSVRAGGLSSLTRQLLRTDRCSFSGITTELAVEYKAEQRQL